MRKSSCANFTTAMVCCFGRMFWIEWEIIVIKHIYPLFHIQITHPYSQVHCYYTKWVSIGYTFRYEINARNIIKLTPFSTVPMLKFQTALLRIITLILMVIVFVMLFLIGIHCMHSWLLLTLINNYPTQVKSTVSPITHYPNQPNATHKSHVSYAIHPLAFQT